MKHLWDPIVTMPVALSALHKLAFITYRSAKEVVGWSAMGCHPCGAMETFFHSLSFFFSTLCIMPFFCQPFRAA